MLAAGGGDGRLTRSDLFAAARRRSGSELAGLARKIDSVFGWDDIVLPDDSPALARGAGRAVFDMRPRRSMAGGSAARWVPGAGVTALFSGPRGHGQDDGRRDDRRRARARPVPDRSRRRSSASTSARPRRTSTGSSTRPRTANAILFFDEADALFGKRTRGQGRPRSLREHRDQPTCCSGWRSTTASRSWRRTCARTWTTRSAPRCTSRPVPVPAAEDRLEIWRRSGRGGHAGGDVDLADLADRFRLSGGNIRNAALAAAFLAAAGRRRDRREHLLLAIRREYQKLGRGLSEIELTGVEPALEEALA